jgi:hypothetical protein
MRARSSAAVLIALLLTLALAAPAQAAASTSQKVAMATSWTQPTAASQVVWNTARLNQSHWADYAFDWSTDYCSASPDKPLGFDFRISCHRHDFGYRNFKKLSVFPANKPRLDDAFYADLKAVCTTYGVVAKQTCQALAWTYYQAVKTFGSLTVTQAQVDAIGARHAA